MRKSSIIVIVILLTVCGIAYFLQTTSTVMPLQNIQMIATMLVIIAFCALGYIFVEDRVGHSVSDNTQGDRPLEVSYQTKPETRAEKKEVPQGRYKSSDMMPFGQTLSFEVTRPGTKYRKTKKDRVAVGDYVSVGDFHFAGDEIRWLGDRQGRGEVILDIEKDGWWYTLTIEAGTSADKLITALKQITPERVSTARNMRKPNIRSETIEGYINQQNLQGQWERQDAISLTITPLYLVILANGSIFEAIRLEQIINVHCIEHPMALDESALLLSFETQVGNRQAYEITDKTFCDRLATASRESVNQEPQRKKKLPDTGSKNL